jgi:hypothetical protein
LRSEESTRAARDDAAGSAYGYFVAACEAAHEGREAPSLIA